MDGAVSLRGSAAITIAFVAIAAGSARAQEQPMVPLAEVARQAEAAKPAVKKATKSYTNANLTADSRGEPAPAPPAPDSGFVSKSLGKPVSAEEMVTRSEAKVESDVLAKQSEDDWRKRSSSLRKQVEDMQSRIAELSVPNALTDSNPALKKDNDNNIANARAALEDLKTRWTRLEASALKVKIPLAWIQPQPSFGQ